MKSILVADDEANIRLLFDELLSGEGYQVTTVGSGREALRKLLKERYDLLITDIKMPDVNGLELLERIRELGQGLPVIICTSFKHLQEDYTVSSAGVFEYLTKPVNLEELKKKVGEALKEK
jgi:CheY-like chemotaxis protein